MMRVAAEMGDPRRKNFRGHDSRNVMRRYENVLGVQVRLPCRGVSAANAQGENARMNPRMSLRM